MSRIPSQTRSTKSGKPFVIRCPEPSEAAQLIRHARLSMSEERFTLTSSEEFTVTEDQEAEWIRATNDSPSNLVIVAELDGAIVGNLDFKAGHRRKVAHTGDFGMSVAREHREDGIGKALLEALLEWAKANPVIEKVNLRVHDSNKRAIALYRGLGFVEEGRLHREVKFKDGTYGDTVLMAIFVKEK